MITAGFLSIVVVMESLRVTMLTRGSMHYYNVCNGQYYSIDGTGVFKCRLITPARVAVRLTSSLDQKDPLLEIHHIATTCTRTSTFTCTRQTQRFKFQIKKYVCRDMTDFFTIKYPNIFALFKSLSLPIDSLQHPNFRLIFLNSRRFDPFSQIPERPINFTLTPDDLADVD